MRVGSSLSLILFWAATASDLAAAEKLPACPTVDQLDEKIISCGDDEIAAQKARECADTIIAGWKLAAGALKATLESTGSTQSRSELETKQDYERTLSTLEAQIASMQDGTDLVADYVLVMVDYPDSNDDSLSLSCFNENFHKVEDIVKELDDEIIKAKDVYALTEKMHSSSGERQAKLDNSVGIELLAGKNIQPATSGHSRNSQSDVTGLREDRAKQKQQVLAVQSESFKRDAFREPSRNPEGAVGEHSPKSLADFNRVQFAAEESTLSGSFLASGALPPHRGPGSTSARAELGAAQIWEPASVGEALWQPSDKNGSTLSLANTRQLAERAPASSGAEEAEPAKSSLAAEPAKPSLAAANGARDLSLFQIVSRRYRSTELFRHQL